MESATFRLQLEPQHGHYPSKHKTFVYHKFCTMLDQRRANVIQMFIDVGPILYKCYTNVLCSHFTETSATGKSAREHVFGILSATNG